jgi:uncharacterized protein YbjQ (UPF0145 family)
MDSNSQEFSKLIRDFISIDLLNNTELEAFYNRLQSFYVAGERHSYSEISSIIFNSENDEDNEILALKAKKLVKMAEERQELTSQQQIDKFKKFLDHINLAILQKEYIKGYVMRFDNKNNALERNIKETEKKALNAISNIRMKIKELNENKTKIYSEFISILGIFSAIVLAAFGGLQILSNILGNIQNVKTSKLLVFSSFSVSAIFTLLFILFNGIAKLTGKNIRSCSCSKEIECHHSIFTKHPSIVIINFILFYVAIIGVFGYIINYRDFLNLYNYRSIFLNGTKLLFLVYVIFTPIVFTGFCIYMRNKDKKLDKERRKVYIDQIF